MSITLETIQSQLEHRNYHTRIVSGTLIVGTDPQEIPELPGGGIFKAFCSIKIQGERFVVEFGQANLPKEKEFISGEEAVAFVEKTFPV